MNSNPYAKLTYKKRNDDHAVFNMLPTWFVEEARLIPESTKRMTLDTLIKMAKPSIIEEQIRCNFWEEYKRVTESGETTMNMNNIVSGYCDLKAFKAILQRSKFKVAYILTPTPPLPSALEDIIQLGTIQMRKILMADPVDENGNINSKIAGVQKQIWETAIKLKHGSTQNINMKTESKSLVINHNQMENAIKNVTPSGDQTPQLPESPPPLPTFSPAELEAAALEDLKPPEAVLNAATIPEDSND